MDLNQKNLVSQEYCAGFVVSRCTNSWTSYHTVCTATTERWEGRQKADFTVIVQLMHLMCKKKSFLFIVTPD